VCTSDVKRKIEWLRAQVDETRTEVDQLAYNLLELGSGVPISFQGVAGMNGQYQFGPWFGTIGAMRGGMGGMGGGMR
jgi:hypothetical protein